MESNLFSISISLIYWGVIYKGAKFLLLLVAPELVNLVGPDPNLIPVFSDVLLFKPNFSSASISFYYWRVNYKGVSMLLFLELVKTGR